MKTTSRLIAALLLSIALAACAAPTAQERIHCPACGYEFTPPMGGE